MHAVYNDSDDDEDDESDMIMMREEGRDMRELSPVYSEV